MALSSGPAPSLVEESSLQDWQVIGSGGFGQIFKARHRQWGCDVAIKLLHHDDGTSASLLREIDMMRQGSSPYVIQVRGVFRGRLFSGPTTQLGLVMEFMERGSLASLQETFRGAPPWPLVFRLAHQVALGINFLHSLSPPLLHLDLKPSNVLLDSSLSAKLTDFGLARLYHSVTRASRKDSEDEGGTISYMPPEAFNLTYSPSKASDIYSYGILLWSIVTWKQPYPYAKSSLVRLRIQEGDRPPMEEIRSQAAGRAGLTRLMALMERCWDPKPQERPSALECAAETEELYKIHKHQIHEVVHQILKKVDGKEEENMIEQVERLRITQPQVSKPSDEVNGCDKVPIARPPIQEIAGRNMSRPSTDQKGKRSSVCPIQTPPLPRPSTRKPPQGNAAIPPKQAFQRNLSSQYNRQFSSPDSFPCRPGPGVHIHLSNITGLQYGNNNNMHIQLTDNPDRKRHPTAPPRVDLQAPHAGNCKDKMGGAG